MRKAAVYYFEQSGDGKSLQRPPLSTRRNKKRVFFCFREKETFLVSFACKFSFRSPPFNVPTVHTFIEWVCLSDTFQRFLPHMSAPQGVFGDVSASTYSNELWNDNKTNNLGRVRLACSSTVWSTNVALMEKYRSMELAVIWGNFSFSNLGCSDLGCSDLGCSDLACFFLFIKILTLYTQHSQLGNSLSTHPNGTNLTKWNFCTLFHNNIHILTKRIAQYPFLNFQ